jgi:hypothetical protein
MGYWTDYVGTLQVHQKPLVTGVLQPSLTKSSQLLDTFQLFRDGFLKFFTLQDVYHLLLVNKQFALELSQTDCMIPKLDSTKLNTLMRSFDSNSNLCDIVWNEYEQTIPCNFGGKFYYFTTELNDLAKTLLGMGYLVDGDIAWFGEDDEDFGVIEVVGKRSKLIVHSQYNEVNIWSWIAHGYAEFRPGWKFKDYDEEILYLQSQLNKRSFMQRWSHLFLSDERPTSVDLREWKEHMGEEEEENSDVNGL